MKRSHKAALLVLLVLNFNALLAAESENPALELCYIEQLKAADEKLTVLEVRALCRDLAKNEAEINPISISPFEKRLLREKANHDNPNVITPHKRNYFLPVSYMDKPNNEPYAKLPTAEITDIAELDHFESKFQLSFKAPLAESLFKQKDILFFGFTIQSYWQMYNSEVSSPFRETNYQPEIFYGVFNDLKLGEWTNRVNVIGVEHQSNGRSQPISRSWNRVYAQFIWENDNWLMMFKPWYRLPEDNKTDPLQPDGDDNPDIDKYMGHFEFSSLYKWDEQTFSLMLRNNLRSNNRGAIQLDWTFPMGSRFKGYAQYFNGYGESLIDYNHSIQRLGFGILLTDVF